MYHNSQSRRFLSLARVLVQLFEGITSNFEFSVRVVDMQERSSIHV